MSFKKTDVNYMVGKEYPFTVVAIHDDFCELHDESNFSVYLQHTNRYRLVRGQKITCRVLAYTQKRPKIELVETEGAEKKQNLEINDVEKILKDFATTWNTRDFSRLLLMIEKDKSFEEECRQWINTLNNADCDTGQVRNDCIRFLEQSSFLSLCNPTEREFYQDRLTIIIELLGYNIKANEMLVNGSGNVFIDNIFEKLKSSGYVFHPQKNFNIMSYLFLADQQLMEDRMDKLFDIIRQWKVEIWGKEPFNSTMIKIIELYVNENIWSLDRIKNNDPLISSLTQALTIQLILMKTANRESEPAYRLCLTRLCTISTYLYDLYSNNTLSLALSNMLNSTCQVPSYTLNDTKGKTVPFRIIGMLPKNIETTNSYIHGKGKLMVSKDGIALYAGQEDGSKPMINGLNLWKQIQVYADKRSVRALPEKVGILDCMHLWEDVEQELFITKKDSSNKTNNKKSHKLDEKVEIIITQQDKDDPNLFYCQIDDVIGGEGTIRLQDIVPYGLAPEIRHFRSETGKNLVFEATIIDKEDDVFRFSMLDQVKKWAEKYYGDNERMVCVIYADRPSKGKGRIPAITKEGISVSLGGFDEIEDTNFKRGDLVIAKMQSEGNGTFHINGKVLKHFRGPQFYVSTAFHKLMQDFAFNDEEDAVVIEEKDLQQSDKILDPTHVREIIRMIDRMASIDSEYVNAYNYLGFARTLCLMIGWEEQANYYRGRMELMVMLHDFAVNDVVNEEKLEDMERINADIFKNNATLHNKLLQLQTVSYMGKTGRETELWRIYTSQTGMVKDIASLVIAYNMVQRNNMTNLCIDLQNRIKQTLRLKGYETNLKMYGSGVEDIRTEYKTSIVFPPDENMRANMPKQMKNIIKVIASFLNTNGGTLYIGVNDSGAGVGVEDDLNTLFFHGDKDKYQRSILDAVVKEWGELVATYIDIAFDHDNEQKDVLAITIKPYPEGVSYEGKWLVRIGSTKREMTKDIFEEFNKGSRMLGFTLENNPVDNDKHSPTPQTNSISNKILTISSTQAEETILTSHIRKNTFEEYKEDYRPHIACLKFLDKGKFCKVTNYDYDQGILTLAVYDEEARAYLILGYEDGRVAKVPVEQLLKFDDYREYSRNTKTKLIFATIANERDAIATVSREYKSKGRVMIRIDRISELEEGSLTSTGERFYKEGIGEVVSYEVIPNEQLEGVSALMEKDARSIGMPVATLSLEIKKQLAKWGIS